MKVKEKFWEIEVPYATISGQMRDMAGKVISLTERLPGNQYIYKYNDTTKGWAWCEAWLEPVSVEPKVGDKVWIKIKPDAETIKIDRAYFHPDMRLLLGKTLEATFTNNNPYYYNTKQTNPYYSWAWCKEWVDIVSGPDVSEAVSKENGMNKVERQSGYVRISRPVVLLMRDYKVYYQTSGSYFQNLQVSPGQPSVSIQFSDVKASDRIYAAENQEELVRVVARGDCLDASHKVSAPTAVSFGDKFKELIAAKNKVAFEGKLGGRDGKFNLVLDASSPNNVKVFDTNGNHFHTISNMNWDWTPYGTLYSQNNEYAFWQWFYRA